MQLLAVVLAALATSQTLALPTNGNEAEIFFSEGANVRPANAAPGEQKIEFIQENEAERLEEALYMYTELLKGMKQGQTNPINEQSDQTNDVAYDQTTILCEESTCDCEVVNYESVEATLPNGDTCLFRNFPYCIGVCTSTYKYGAVEDRPGLEPHVNEEYECCAVTSTTSKTLKGYCRDSSTGNRYWHPHTFTVPTGCRCSSNSPCSRR